MMRDDVFGGDDTRVEDLWAVSIAFDIQRCSFQCYFQGFRYIDEDLKCFTTRIPAKAFTYKKQKEARDVARIINEHLNSILGPALYDRALAVIG